MKVIGKDDNGQYICIVSHSELEKVTNKYYSSKDRLEQLRVGAEFDLGAGHDYRAEISGVCRTMTESMQRFEMARKTLMRFATMVADVDAAQAQEGAA